MATVLASTPAPAASHAVPEHRPPRRDRLSFRVGLVLSALVHVLIFATVRFSLTVEPRPVRAPLRSYRVEPVMQAYNLEPIAVPAAPVIEPPPRVIPLTETPPPPVVLAPILAPPTPAAAAPDPQPSAFERLSRGFADPRLLSPVGELPPPVLSEADILRLRLEALLGMYNDSLAAVVAAASRATDWTVRGRDGERWGISPGKIHLGKITLPLPFAFSAPPGRREEVAAKVRSWYETQSQASRLEAEETFEARVKAIRERQKAQRDSTRRGGG